MLLTIFGPPSAFIQWGVHVVRIMSDVVLRDVNYVTTCEIEKLREAFAERTQPHLFFFADCPDRGIRNIFLKTRSRGLIFYEDPDDITGFVVRERDLDWFSAARLTNQCLMSMQAIAQAGHFKVIKRGDQQTFGEFLDSIISYFQISVSEDDFNEILRRVDPSGAVTLDTNIADLLSAWSNARPIGSGMLDVDDAILGDISRMNVVSRNLFFGRMEGAIVWPSKFFIPGDDPKAYFNQSVDLLGPARCVCFGPYLHLPEGEWEVEVEMMVSGNLSGNRIEIDVYHEEVVVAETFRLPPSGAFIATARFVVLDARNPVQFRFIIKEGAIEGRLSIGDAHIYGINVWSHLGSDGEWEKSAIDQADKSELEYISNV